MYKEIQVNHIPFQTIIVTATIVRGNYSGKFRRIYLHYPKLCYWFYP